jgi:hypothetical protein
VSDVGDDIELQKSSDGRVRRETGKSESDDEDDRPEETGQLVVRVSGLNQATLQKKNNLNGFFNPFICETNYCPIPWRDSISRPITQQADTTPLDHAARVNLKSY